jgi:hypothetical protein
MIVSTKLPLEAVNPGMVVVDLGKRVVSIVGGRNLAPLGWNLLPALTLEDGSFANLRYRSGRAFPATHVLASTEGRPLGFEPVGGLPDVGDYVFVEVRKAYGVGGVWRGYKGRVTAVAPERGRRGSFAYDSTRKQTKDPRDWIWTDRTSAQSRGLVRVVEGARR